MTTLPSISNLLNDDTPPSSLPPSFQFSPPSPPVTACTPALSPSNSCVSLSPRLDELPPLQGFDPPVRKLSGTPIVAPWSTDNTNNMTTPPSPPESSSSSSSSIPSPPLSHSYLKPSPPHQPQRQQFYQMPPQRPQPQSHPLPPHRHQQPAQQQQQQHRQQPQQQQQQQQQQQPTAQILISPTTGQPILKRRRGRPPTNREPVNDGGFTFLAPVTWTVQQPPEQNPVPEPKTDQHEMMAAFSSSNMDTVLQMPRKKRGRKPKTQLAGNSCFVWKELPSTRSPSKKVVKKSKA